MACVGLFEYERKEAVVRDVVVNHSPADSGGLAGNVSILGGTQKSEEDEAGKFSFTTNLKRLEKKVLT